VFVHRRYVRGQRNLVVGERVECIIDNDHGRPECLDVAETQ
jgi:hypothetical protein